MSVTKPILIALASPAMGMGKSTVADHLVRHHSFVHVKFAGALKDMIRTMLMQHAGIRRSFVERYVDGDLKEVEIPELGVTSRHLQQTLGTEWGRNQVRADLWVHLTRLRVRSLLAAGSNVVIDDMRFPNEGGMVREEGGHAIQIVRPGVGYTGHHASEGGLTNFPFDNTIINDGSLADLHSATETLLRSLRDR